MILKGGSITREKTCEAILKLHNIPKNEVTIQSFAGYDELTAALREGKTDIAFSPLTPNTGYVQDLTTTGDAIIVPWTDVEMKSFGDMMPGVSTNVFPAGSFKGQEKPVNTPFAPNCWMAYESLPEDLVYAVVAAVYDNWEEFATYFADTKQWALPDAITPEAIPGPMHDGAIKYYKEKGFWTSAHEEKQKQLEALVKH